MLPVIIGGAVLGLIAVLDHNYNNEEKQLQTAQSKLSQIQGQLGSLKNQITQAQNTYGTDRGKLYQQTMLEGKIITLQQQVKAEQAKVAKAQQLFAQSQQQLQQQQQLQAQISQVQQQIQAETQKLQQAQAQVKQEQSQIQQQKKLQAQVSQLTGELQQAALQKHAVSDAAPDGYNQAQLTYLEAHQNLLPSGQVVAAQGGKLLLEAGNGHPIVPNIIGVQTSYGDPGFIVGDHWYPNITQANAASASTGMPVNPAYAVDPTRFNPYVTPVTTNNNSSGSYFSNNYHNSPGLNYNPYSTQTPTSAATQYRSNNGNVYTQNPNGTYTVTSGPGTGMTVNYGQVQATIDQFGGGAVQNHSGGGHSGGGGSYNSGSSYSSSPSTSSSSSSSGSSGGWHPSNVTRNSNGSWTVHSYGGGTSTVSASDAATYGWS